MINNMKKYTVADLKKELENYPDNWVFTIHLPYTYIHPTHLYGFDEGEVGIGFDEDLYEEFNRFYLLNIEHNERRRTE
jgi:hypothetical protein